jgi:hypothetical protein
VGHVRATLSKYAQLVVNWLFCLFRTSSASKDSDVVGRGGPGRPKRARLEAGGDEAGDVGGVWDGANRTTAKASTKKQPLTRAKRKSSLEKSMLIVEQSHSGGT